APASASEDKTATDPATVPNSSDTSALGVGDYSYQATFNGNGNYASATGDCEPFHVGKATPSISTVVKDSNGNTVDNGANKAAVGVVVHDTSTLWGGTTGFGFAGTPSTVTYKLYPNLSCAAPWSSSQNVTVTDPASVPDSDATSALGAGDYSYQATYNGNANYTAATGDCEPFHVNKGTPSISTIVKDSNGNTVDNGLYKASVGVV